MPNVIDSLRYPDCHKTWDGRSASASSYQSLFYGLGGLCHSTMLTVCLNMPSPANDICHISSTGVDDRDRFDTTGRVNTSYTHNQMYQNYNDNAGMRRTTREFEYQTTRDGDVVFVQPSFDDGVSSADRDRKSNALESPQPQSRSPLQSEGDGVKYEANETRNEASPARALLRAVAGHVRNLSSHFFDATTLSDRDSSPAESSAAALPNDALGDDSGSRKHRRIFSNDFTNPNMAHRRLNSRGAARSVRRATFHQREDSQGLDILSAAVDASKDELAAAVGSNGPSPWDPPSVQANAPFGRPSLGQVSTGSQETAYSTAAGAAGHHRMNPPPHRRTNSSLGASHAGSLFQSNPAPGAFVASSQPNPPFQATYTNFPPPPSYYGGYHTHIRPATSTTMFPFSQQYPDLYGKSHYVGTDLFSFHQAPQTQAPHSEGRIHQGSQTFVTTIAVGNGTKTIPATATSTLKDASTTLENAATGVPSQVGHHRKMSSFSSIGTIFGSFLGGQPESSVPERPGHHRKASSTVSFLKDIDIAFGEDGNKNDSNDAFLRNLHASNSAPIAEATQESPPASPTLSDEDESEGRDEVTPNEVGSDTKLAQGGTSKRVRRKCTVEGCANRVVQGGLCISHGAKRKTCKHPGCTKNVKKAGLCSTHGPARKRCDAEGCQKVAVQGGRCIAHGAKKKLCAVDGCQKQAILSGMCKKHHDQSGGMGGNGLNVATCQEVNPPNSHKPTHTRGLSIFREMSADAVQNLLNETAALEGPVPHTLPPSEKRTW